MKITVHLLADKLAFGPLFRLSEKPKYKYRGTFKVLRDIFLRCFKVLEAKSMYRINDLGVFFMCLEVNLHGRLSKRREGSKVHTMEGRNRI